VKTVKQREKERERERERDRQRDRKTQRERQSGKRQHTTCSPIEIERRRKPQDADKRYNATERKT
jgi:hypothetical protein